MTMNQRLMLFEGPNQILHNSLDCMKVIHGPQAKCIKANWYSTMEYGPHRILNLDAITDKTEHRFRRQVWDKAFNGQGMRPPQVNLAYMY